MKKLYSLLIASFVLFNLSAQAQNTCSLVAAFGVQQAAGNPLQFAFTNQSSGFASGDSIRWNFGDGSVSYDVNPTHTYAVAGTYNVCLRVKKPQPTATTPACVSEICHSITVTAPVACNVHANYTHHPDSINPRKVYFTNTTTQSVASATASWNFGDGSTASSWNAVHEYAQPGRYYVCLTVHSGDCISTHCDSLTVTGPVAFNCNAVTLGFYDTRDSLMPNRIKFTATASAPILEQTWTIAKLPAGNPVTLHGSNPTYTFQDTGSYRVCLHAKFSNDCTKEFCKTIHIGSVPPASAGNCMQIYPNPAHDMINAVLMLSSPVMIHAYVYNTSNVMVAHKEQQGVVGANTISINTGLLASGIYTIKLVWEGHSCSATFFKQ